LCFYLQVLKRPFIRIFAAFAAVVAVLIGICSLKSDASILNDTIRVAIFKNAAAVTVEGEGLLAAGDGGVPVRFETPASVRQVGENLVLDGIEQKKLVFASAGILLINGRAYRGKVEIISTDKGLLAVNELQLEDYLKGVINSEISSAWPVEVVKAQAVIARTYAVNRKIARMNAPYHLEATVMDQVYGGYATEDSGSQRAVDDTAGEVLTFDGAVIQAFYHSSCGGRTESSENVWGMKIPYLEGVDCKYCFQNRSVSWEMRIKLKETADKLRQAGMKVANILDIKAGDTDSRGRLANVILVTSQGEKSVKAVFLRKALGYGELKSTNFTVTVADEEAQFSGVGNGHGVGLCQWGARDMAAYGSGYREILSHYYPGTTLQKLHETGSPGIPNAPVGF